MEKELNKTRKLEFQKKIGLHIRKKREKAGITAAELARRCYMDKPNIHKLESGKFNPSSFYLSKICQGLHISLEELFRGFHW